MKRLQLLVTGCGLLLAFCAYGQNAALTKDSIIQMAKAGLPDDVIVAKIKSDPPAAKFGVEDLVALKSAGVDDTVLRALVAPDPKPDVPPVNAPSPAAPPAPRAVTHFVSSTPSSGDVVYRKTRLADAKGKGADADLVFKPEARLLVLRIADRPVAEIPYASIDKMSYDYSKHHRIKEGAVVMVASLGAGAVVMLTQSKDHWFTVDYHDGATAKSLVMKLDKREYKSVLRMATDQTGKEIEFLKDAKL